MDTRCCKLPIADFLLAQGFQTEVFFFLSCAIKTPRRPTFTSLDVGFEKTAQHKKLGKCPDSSRLQSVLSSRLLLGHWRKFNQHAAIWATEQSLRLGAARSGNDLYIRFRPLPCFFLFVSTDYCVL